MNRNYSKKLQEMVKKYDKPVKPPTTYSIRIQEVVKYYRRNPDKLIEEIQRSYAEMNKSLVKSREVLRKLIAEYHQVGDSLYIDDNEVKMISIKMIKEQIEEVNERIKCRTIGLICFEKMNVTITTTNRELETQMDIFLDDFSSIRLNATVDFTSLEDVHKTLQEMHLIEEDKKECKRKLEMIGRLEKEINLDVDSTNVVPGDLDFIQIQNKWNELEELINYERKKITFIERYDVEEEKSTMLRFLNISFSADGRIIH